MKLWLDDVRPAPDGWTWVKDAHEAIALLARGEVEIASLDHDLGDDPWTGYYVLCWVERVMGDGQWYGPLPRFLVHSSNPVGRSKMEQAIDSIEKLHRAWLEEAE
jgi:hypothetical protein